MSSCTLIFVNAHPLGSLILQQYMTFVPSPTKRVCFMFTANRCIFLNEDTKLCILCKVVYVLFFLFFVNIIYRSIMSLETGITWKILGVVVAGVCVICYTGRAEPVFSHSDGGYFLVFLSPLFISSLIRIFCS